MTQGEPPAPWLAFIGRHQIGPLRQGFAACSSQIRSSTSTPSASARADKVRAEPVPRGSRARTHGTTISQPTWPGVPDRLHPAHGAGAGPATFRDPRGPRGLCGNGAECESPRSRSLCAAPANALGPSGEGPRAPWPHSLQPAGASHADPTRAPQGRTATRPRPVRPLRPTGPTGSARLRTPNRRGELPASHPRSYHLLADSGDRSCFERGGLGCGRSQLRVTVPYQPDRVGQRPPLRREYQLNRSLVRSERLSV